MGSTAETRSPLRCVPVSLRSAVFRSPSALLCSGLLTGTPLCSGLPTGTPITPLCSGLLTGTPITTLRSPLSVTGDLRSARRRGGPAGTPDLRRAGAELRSPSAPLCSGLPPLCCVPVSAPLCSGLLTGTPITTLRSPLSVTGDLRSARRRGQETCAEQESVTGDLRSARRRGGPAGTPDLRRAGVSHGRPPVGTAARWPSGHPRPAPSRS